MRTLTERKNAIELLKENKKICSPTNYFGENNHVRIDIMIDVISENRSEDFVYKNYQSNFEDGTEDTVGHGNWQSGINALEYLRGEIEINDLLYPA